MKIALIYSYNGSKFQGSQTQPNGKTVEDALNLALRKVGIFQNALSSSRTDSAVHALMQVSTTICGDFWDLNRLKNELNRHLPYSVRIKDIKKVNDDFHPRYSAKARTYRYLLAHGKPNVFLADFVYFCQILDIKKLNIALGLFCGEHDFSGFYKLGSDEKSPIRNVFRAHARRFYFKDEPFTMIVFKANGFLRSQVRMMVANAISATKHESHMNALKERFVNSRIPNSENSRIPTRIPAPPQALYLKKIHYAEF